MPQSQPAAAQATSPQTPVAVTVDGQPLALQIPQTPVQVEGLRQRREILRDQLERANNRRDGITGQLQQDELPQEAREGLKTRLAEIDQRILQIEREQAQTEQLLANASPELLAEVRGLRNNANSVSEDDAILAGFFAFGAGVALTFIVGRIRRRRWKKSAAAAPALMAEDPRIERLTHAVDAIAEEVERIGEGQRFVTQLLSDKPARVGVRE